MAKVTQEELGFDLESLKELQHKRQTNIDRLIESIEIEEAVYNEREKIITVLEADLEDDSRDQKLIRHDLNILYKEQSKRQKNIQIIREAIEEEQGAINHERKVIEEIKEKS
jgi:predicted nucleotidyltransferase